MSVRTALAEQPPTVTPDRPPPPGPPVDARWRRLLPSVLPGIAMVVIALVRAGRPVLSWDEVSTADVAARTPGQIWALVQNVDAVFGPYYFFMHAWTRLAGDSEVALRLPSILAMGVAVGLAGELGRRLFTPLTGLLAGLFLCVMPNLTRYAAEARPYAFTCLFSVLAVLLLLSALERGRAWRWVAYGIAVVLLGVSHLIALTTLAAHAVIVARRRPRPVRAWVVTMAVSGAALLPVIWLGTQHRDKQLGWIDPLTLGTLYKSPGDIVGAVATAWVLLGMIALLRWRPAAPVVYMAVMAVAPLVVVGIVSLVSSPFWVGRYLLIVLAPTAILAAAAVTGSVSWSSSRARATAALRVLAVLVLLAATAYPDQRRVRTSGYKYGPDYRGIATLLERHQQPGDTLVYEPRSRALRAGMEHYLRDAPARPRDVLMRRPAAEIGQLRADEHLRDAAARVRGLDRVWLIVDGRRDDPTVRFPALRKVLRERFQLIGFWHLDRATVTLYRNRGAG